MIESLLVEDVPRWLLVIVIAVGAVFAWCNAYREAELQAERHERKRAASRNAKAIDLFIQEILVEVRGTGTLTGSPVEMLSVAQRRPVIEEIRGVLYARDEEGDLVERVAAERDQLREELDAAHCWSQPMLQAGDELSAVLHAVAQERHEERSSVLRLLGESALDEFQPEGSVANAIWQWDTATHGMLRPGGCPAVGSESRPPLSQAEGAQAVVERALNEHGNEALDASEDTA